MQKSLGTYTAAVVVMVAAAAFAVPALAGNKPGAGVSPSIGIATVNGTSAALTQDPAPKLGDDVTFATVVGSIAGWEYPMVVVSCYQDVNGDGKIDTSVVSPDKVFGMIDLPDATFLMGNYQSDWTRRGGVATCHAVLYAYGWKRGSETVRFLASTKDWQAAG
jgi:hypothetical protein